MNCISQVFTEEIDLPIEDQHDIALVTDTKGNVVVAVSNSPTYQAAMGTEEDQEEEENQGDEDPTLWADSTPPRPTRRPVSRGSPMPDSRPGPRPRPVVASRAPLSTPTVSPPRPAAAGPSRTSQTRSVSPARPSRTSHLPSRQSAAPPSQPPAASHASQPSRDERGGVRGTRRPLSPVGEESERPTKRLKQSIVPKQRDALRDALKKKLGTRK